ncbi:hypothetical protein [Pseudobdellovibrio exovorus]|uniref:Uncharacterized protein n=1 Tax=Pseudobdellovibrio exovorus JSS TaxID=1184267 RepID=M4VTC3_9BACT|nr:hypothetical protein [Pseudobdellovibrio exovorus]AGH96454.1 hypothetical protein A11Q_2238 [Pseudobdellovibrio exovorus JSS]
MRQLSLFSILFILINSLALSAFAKIDFASLIQSTTEEQNITATEVHRFAGVNTDQTPANYDIVVSSEASEFQVKLKPLKYQPKTKNSVSSRAVASEKKRVLQKKLKNNTSTVAN